MKKINKKGFTLIELLAVIVIMGILMMVAIPAMSRYMENSRKDTFNSTASEYINSIRNLWASDNITCGGVFSTSVGVGKYYVPIDSSDAGDILESGGSSPWSNATLKGYVMIDVDTAGEGEKATTKNTYFIQISDGVHGFKTYIESTKMKRTNVKTSGATQPPTPTDGTVCTIE